jgi:hypothetical protein
MSSATTTLRLPLKMAEIADDLKAIRSLNDQSVEDSSKRKRKCSAVVSENLASLARTSSSKKTTKKAFSSTTVPYSEARELELFYSSISPFLSHRPTEFWSSSEIQTFCSRVAKTKNLTFPGALPKEARSRSIIPIDILQVLYKTKDFLAVEHPEDSFQLSSNQSSSETYLNLKKSNKRGSIPLRERKSSIIYPFSVGERVLVKDFNHERQAHFPGTIKSFSWMNETVVVAFTASSREEKEKAYPFNFKGGLSLIEVITPLPSDKKSLATLKAYQDKEDPTCYRFSRAQINF